MQVVSNSYSNNTITETLTSNFCTEKVRRQSELCNHLSNVLVTVSDRKIPHETSTGIIDYYMADIVSAQDYYAFGMEMPGRTFNPTSYAYDFNGKRTDYELEDWQDYGNRMYMKRICRFPTPDPLTAKYPMLTPYQFASNRPTVSKDIDGLEAEELPEEDIKNPEETQAEGALKPMEETPKTEEDINRNAEEFFKQEKDKEFENNPLAPKTEAEQQSEKLSNALQKIQFNTNYPPVQTPHGTANQANTPEALNLRSDVMQGKTLYRIGTWADDSKTGAEAQFWSPEDPQSMTPEVYAAKYGMPLERVVNADFIETSTIAPGVQPIVRPAPTMQGAPPNSGGGLEVVVPYAGTQNNQIIILH